MSKFTVGLLAGVALASVTAVSLGVTSAGGPAAAHDTTLNLAAPAAGDTGAERADRVVAKAATTTAPAVVRYAKIVRQVRLSLPASGKVGTNVAGFIQVVDSNGTVTSPVTGARVFLQEKRAGSSAFANVTDDVTDADGSVPVSFLSQANASWRAAFKPATGALVYSATVVTTATVQLNWSARPDLDVVHGVATSYAFRISPMIPSTAHLEMASSSAPTKWIPVKGVAVPPSGVVTQSVTFPTAGTWLVRGAASGRTTATGYTTTLTVTVG